MDAKCGGVILINDIQGCRFDGKVKSAFKKIIPGTMSQSIVNVLQGELLMELTDNEQFNYQLHRDQNVYMHCADTDVAPLSYEEFLLLEAIREQMTRLEVFQTKIDWGPKIKEGSKVYVDLYNGPNLATSTPIRATVHHKGKIGNEPGIWFGVEIMEEEHRAARLGTTDGTFQGQRYFMCEDGCGLFVSLRRISPAKKSQPSYSSIVTKSDNSGSNVDAPPSQYKHGQRVAFYDIHGVKHYGKVGWSGRKSSTRSFGFAVVGIETEDECFNSDYERSIPGMSHYMKSSPKRHVLFLPESLVDAVSQAPAESLDVRNIAKDLKLTHRELMEQQKEGLHQANKARSRKVLDQAGISDENISITEQQRALSNFEAEKELRDSNSGGTSKRIHGDVGRNLGLERGTSFDSHTSGQGGGYSDGNMHTEGRKFHQKPEHEYDVIRTPPTQRYLSEPDHRHEQVPRGTSSPSSRHHIVDQHRDHAQNHPVQDSFQHDHLHNMALQLPQKLDQDPSSQSNLPKQDNSVAAATGEVDDSFMLSDLTTGSLIQIPSSEPAGPWRYGTIKWIGLVSGIQGKVAGIELDEAMDGCSDGTFHGTGQKFFSCENGKGLYYPLRNLKPDARYAPEVAAPNPLRHISGEEPDADSVLLSIDQYIGDKKGIQGHQNSCYMDATLFGLFALTTEFDSMFLQKSDADSSSTTHIIGTILWKNIVNPLRKNGVVKFESVMKLREHLDQLGKMQGITQDEKDPEEFLNMMFKVILHVSPFISIRRPYGVENEYFVQLFFEMEESKEIPSIGDLLDRMFSEQNISFTEVPSKLLIQVPRFGKKFQTFRKIIPALTLNVAGNVDLKHPLECFNCGNPAKKVCEDCSSQYRSDSGPPSFCDKCLKVVHSRSIRKRHKPQWCHELKLMEDVSVLELLCVICIETSHYVCFAKQEDRWIFFDSMANRVFDKYNIPKVIDCTAALNEWVYPHNEDRTRLFKTPPRELPEYVRRFTQDIYMCVYIQQDMSMYK